MERRWGTIAGRVVRRPCTGCAEALRRWCNSRARGVRQLCTMPAAGSRWDYFCSPVRPSGPAMFVSAASLRIASIFLRRSREYSLPWVST